MKWFWFRLLCPLMPKPLVKMNHAIISQMKLENLIWQLKNLINYEQSYAYDRKLLWLVQFYILANVCDVSFLLIWHIRSDHLFPSWYFQFVLLNSINYILDIVTDKELWCWYIVAATAETVSDSGEAWTECHWSRSVFWWFICIWCSASAAVCFARWHCQLQATVWTKTIKVLIQCM